jgi:Leucine-rich repeat (LRR) protein
MTSFVLHVASLFLLLTATRAGILTQSEILSELYDSTNGAGWLQNGGWCGGDPCAPAWHGVTCSGVDVIGLTLTYNNLDGPIPSAVCGLTGLTFLRLSGNAIRGTLPECVGTSMSSLVELQLGGTVGEKLTGTLPPSYGSLSNLVTLSLEGNRLTGTVPCSYGALTRLRVVRLYDNELSGELGECLLGMGSASGGTMNFYVGNNRFTGAAPVMWPHLLRLSAYGNLFTSLSSRIGDCTTLINMRLDSNMLTGNLPSSIHALSGKLSVLNLARNALSGPIPDWLGDMALLTKLVLHDNALEGTIPVSFGGMTGLTELDLSNNLLVGCVPGAVTNMSSLVSLRLSGNLLVGPIPAFPAGSMVSKLILSENPLAMSFAALAQSLWETSVEDLEASDCSLTGGFTSDAFVSLVPGGSGAINLHLKSLRKLALASNSLEGSLVVMAWLGTSYPSLVHLDLSHNRLTGGLPDSFGSFSYLFLHGNGYMAARGLPSFLTIGTTRIEQDAGATLCPEIVPTVSGRAITLDASYLGFWHCECAPGFFGRAHDCRPCLPHGVCPGGGSMGAQVGYFPEPSIGNVSGFVKCVDAIYGFTACNPAGTVNFSCADGYGGRLCSECVNGYFDSSKRCISCGTGEAVLLLVLAGCLALATSAFVIWRMLTPTKSGTGMLRKVFVLLKNGAFYVQTASYMILGLPLRWPPSLLSTARICNWLSLTGTGISCFVPISVAEDVSFWFVQSSSVFLLLSFWMLCVLRYVLTSRTRLRDEYVIVEGKGWMRRARAWGIKACDGLRFYVLSIVNFMYMPTAYRSFSQFSCVYDEHMGRSFLSGQPFMACDSESGWPARRNFAILSLIIYVLGCPMTFLAILLLDGPLKKDPVTEQTLPDDAQYDRNVIEYALNRRSYAHSIVLPYKSSLQFWELVVLARRLALVLTFTLAAACVEALVFCMFTVLLAYALIHITFRPFHDWKNNAVEGFSIGVILLTFVTGLSYSLGPEFGRFRFIEYVITPLNWIVIASFVAVAILEVPPLSSLSAAFGRRLAVRLRLPYHTKSFVVKFAPETNR